MPQYSLQEAGVAFGLQAPEVQTFMQSVKLDVLTHLGPYPGTVGLAGVWAEAAVAKNASKTAVANIFMLITPVIRVLHPHPIWSPR